MKPSEVNYTPHVIKMIAADYQRRPHEPKSINYLSFVVETVKQFRGLQENGWKFELSTKDPYPTSAEMFLDLDAKRLKVFTGGSLAKDNCLNRMIEGNWTVNEAFRAVHDVLGHGPTRCAYETFAGELEAYHNHKERYSRLALPALFSETIGQLCYHSVTGEFVELQQNKVMKSWV